MFPILLRLGPFHLFGLTLGPWALHTYGLLVASGFLAAILVVMRGARREGLPSETMLDLTFLTVLAAIVGSRLMYAIFNPAEYLREPLRILKVWEGGLVFHGGLLLAIPLCWAMIRRAGLPLWRTADIFAPAIALGQAIGRLGCFAAGCCYGCPSDAPWSIVFTHPETLAPRNVALFPVQLLASLSGWVIFALLVLWRPHRKAAGQIFWLYLALASFSRVLEDAFRGTEAKTEVLPWLSATQVIAIALGITGVALFVGFGRRERRS